MKIKSLLSLTVMIVAAAFAALNMVPADAKNRVFIGDVDENSIINIEDATLIQKYCSEIVDLSPDQLAAANVIGDSQVFVSCATAVQQYLADNYLFPNIGKYKSKYNLPDYWEDYLEQKISQINELKQSLGNDAFSFVSITDIHESQNLGKNSGKIAKEIMDNCDIKYTLILGDVVTRGCLNSSEEMEESFVKAEDILVPIRDKALQIKGNHDGAWGYDPPNTYQYQFSNELIYKYIYSNVKKINGTHFSPENEAYYIDDTENKVRYIMLNSHHNDELKSSDGSAVHNPFRVFRFGQKQIDWLALTALDVPEGYSIIVASHVPIYVAYLNSWGGENGENVLVRKLLNAYNKKTHFNYSFDGEFENDNVNIDADFSNAKGKVLATFSGHIHYDSAISCNGIMTITTRCDAREENRDGNQYTTKDDYLYNERVKGTVTEQSFDVITVSPSQNKVYCTKIGAGEDRVISIN